MKIHLRNITGTLDEHKVQVSMCSIDPTTQGFVETFLDDGVVDIYGIIRTLVGKEPEGRENKGVRFAAVTKTRSSWTTLRLL